MRARRLSYEIFRFLRRCNGANVSAVERNFTCKGSREALWAVGNNVAAIFLSERGKETGP
jgi:hypothetical protein